MDGNTDQTAATMLKGFVLQDRTLLALEGGDIRTVLQGIVTADIDHLSPGGILYGALLTPQGKFLVDFFLIDDGPERVLIDVASDLAVNLAQRLKMYCLRRDARIAEGPGWQVAQVWGGTPSPAGDLKVLKDPRSDALGGRIYAPEIDAALSDLGATPATAEEFAALRVAHTIPETGIELVPDETYILEAGFERLSGVDFKKGCYVGQEVTARMKHKTELRKGLARVAVTGSAKPGTAITANDKPVGTLYTVVGGHGIAHLRFDRAGSGMQAGDAKVDYTADG